MKGFSIFCKRQSGNRDEHLMRHGDWYLAVESLATVCLIRRKNDKVEVSKVDEDEFGGEGVTMSHECNYMSR